MIAMNTRLGRSLLAALGLLLLGSGPGAAQEQRPGVWGTKAPMPMRRQETAIATVDGKIYVIGGNRSPDEKGNAVNSTRTDEYDPKTNKWRARAAIPHGTNHAWAVGVNGKVYVVGGFDEGNKAGTYGVYEYDPKTNKWRDRVSLPDPPRGSAGLAVLDGKIHVIGGRDTDKSFETHDVYDPRTNRWSMAAPLPPGHGRDHIAAVAAIGGQIHVIGGRFARSDKMTDQHDVYDPKTNSWHAEVPLPTARSGGPGTVYRGLIIVMGGERPGGPMYLQNEAYDPRTKKWLTLAPLPEGRHATGAVVLGDTLYIPGGGAEPGGGKPVKTLLTFTLPKNMR
jgi:N-acetylneuraminic acid mutarotase